MIARVPSIAYRVVAVVAVVAVVVGALAVVAVVAAVDVILVATAPPLPAELDPGGTYHGSTTPAEAALWAALAAVALAVAVGTGLLARAVWRGRPGAWLGVAVVFAADLVLAGPFRIGPATIAVLTFVDQVSLRVGRYDFTGPDDPVVYVGTFVEVAACAGAMVAMLVSRLRYGPS